MNSLPEGKRRRMGGRTRRAQQLCEKQLACVAPVEGEEVCLSLQRPPLRLHAQSERTHPQPESTPYTCDVIGGRLWLLSRAALPVLNKNFVLSGWWAQRSAPVYTHEHARVLTHTCGNEHTES